MRAYLRDETDHEELKELLRSGKEAVSTIDLARIEFVSAVRAAHRARRLRQPDAFIAGFDDECARGTITLLRPDPDRLLSEGTRLADAHPIRTLDAIHLATALIAASDTTHEAPVVFVTRDEAQANAARAEGLEVLPTRLGVKNLTLTRGS